MTSEGGEAEEYAVPARSARARLEEKGSRFLAFLEPVRDEEEANAVLDRLAAEHPDATHHCWAWRLGWPPRERSRDAGEPSGTAGAPILRALAAAELSDALLVVARWYGGTNLGKGGLVRAYGGAAREAAAAAGVARRLRRRTIEIRLPYEDLGALQRLVHPPEVEVTDERYGADVTLRLAVVASRLPAIEDLVASRGLALRGLEDRRGSQ